MKIITDSASDITKKEAEKMEIDIIQLDIMFDDGPQAQYTDEDFISFYQRLQKCEHLPTTSRASIQDYAELYEDAENNGEEVLVLCLSSGLSGTIESARLAKEQVGYAPVYIVDTRQAILTQRLLVEHAVQLRSEGFSAEQIAAQIEQIRDDYVVCGVVDTLEYLKMGGRIPAGLAVLGNALNIKPVIVLEDGVLKTIGKARGRKAGIMMLYKRLEKDGLDTQSPIYFGYTSNREIGESFMLEAMDRYHLENVHLHPVGGIIGTHVGTDCIGIAYRKKKPS